MTEPAKTVTVWDRPVRLFHGLLVGAVGVALATGYLAPEWWMGAHLWSGYLILALMGFRLIWGVWGSEYARFASFAYGPRETLSHLRALLFLKGRHAIGHNPAGAAMIWALALLLALLVATGLVMAGGEEKQGPLAGLATYGWGMTAKKIHGPLALMLLGLIAGHVLGVIVESRLVRENLIWAMISGKKRVNDAPAREPRPARLVPALSALLVMLAMGAGSLAALARLPATGVYDLAPQPAYQKECGACHHAFHPSLLPASSWQGVMVTLDDHFGEDATLPWGQLEAIATWLATNAAEHWDTEAAHRFRVLDPAQPLRITATPYWARKHRDLAKTVFAQKSVGGPANCNACHADAPTGLYADQEIRIPKEKTL
ncbi:MAG: cytochrome b/b6 domain-containing protein [Rhodospirillales bacterium]|nr:cytochrome b/b6 domain-containing protein [Rhodospirillales bacterium]